jgi:quinol monooxygenase YgiN
MIMIAGFIDFRTDRIDVIAHRLTQLEVDTAQEDGCIYYAMSLADRSSGHVTVLEQWRDQAALDVHLRNPIHRQFVKEYIPEVRHIDIKVFDVQTAREILLVDGAVGFSAAKPIDVAAC